MKKRRRRKDIPGAIREKVMDRDGHKCFFCSMTRQQSQHIFGKSLHIHHIMLDGHAENPDNRIESLLTLCLMCHQKLHALFKKYLKKKI